MNIFERTISLIAPFRCLGCGVDGNLACSACNSSQLIPKNSACWRCNKITNDFKTCKPCRNHSDLFAVYVGYHYDDLSQKLIHALKFERAQSASMLIAHLLDQRLPHIRWDCISYVPTAPKRVRQRGYDQSKLIAKELAAIRGIKVQKLLVRIDNSRQVGNSSKMRSGQAQKAFQVAGKMKYNNVLIIDDVMASGSTLNAISKILKVSGVKRVSGVVFARS